MFTAERVERLASEVMLDIGSELRYWQSCYPDRPFYDRRLPFIRYVPTFKFGYDSFLLYHRTGLVDALPLLVDRYKTISAVDRLDWTDASQIINATWLRMRPGSAQAGTRK